MAECRGFSALAVYILNRALGIIQTPSIGRRSAVPSLSADPAAKFAVEGFSETFRADAIVAQLQSNSGFLARTRCSDPSISNYSLPEPGQIKGNQQVLTKREKSGSPSLFSFVCNLARFVTILMTLT
jgi:hypothetical protein